jgi:hypothetical protein
MHKEKELMKKTLILSIAALLSARSELVHWPSCESCVNVTDRFREDWVRTEPQLLAALPSELCRECSVPNLCEAVVVEGIKAVTSLLKHVNGTQICKQLDLCNETTPPPSSFQV